MLTEDDVRRIVREELNHGNLGGMPDHGGVYADHDGRYYSKEESIKSLNVNKVDYSATEPEDPQVGDVWIKVV